VEKVLILDTSAFISHPGSLKGLTVREVLEEARSLTAKWRSCLDSVKVLEPSATSLGEVERSVRETGDRLSKTDVKLLALALDVKKEGKDPEILTDDYSIQNLARVLGVGFSGVGEEGIKKVFRWISVCPSCGRSFPPSEQECRFCGSKLKRKPAKYIHERGIG
jgi:UPF0271 protein